MARRSKGRDRVVEILTDCLHDWERAGITSLPVATDKGGVKWALAAQARDSDSVDSSEPQRGYPAPPVDPESRVNPHLPTKTGDTMDPSSKLSIKVSTPLEILPYEEVETILKGVGKEEKGILLSTLALEVAKCRRCSELAGTRTQTVFGTGNPDASLVFVGEGPGADEDRQGIPFVGRSGQLLTSIITNGMKLSREDVYICNIVRCRPPGNRNPLPAEAACCRPFLEATLKIINPQYICCLGAVAATNLLGTNASIGSLRGTIHEYLGIKVVCTYHPAYLLRNPPAKTQAWEDIKLLMREMNLL